MTPSSPIPGVMSFEDISVWHDYAHVIAQKAPGDPDVLASLFAAPRYGQPPAEVLYVVDFVNPLASAAIGFLEVVSCGPDKKKPHLFDNRPWVVETPWIVHALVDEYDFDHPNVEIITEIEKLITEIRDREIVVRTTAECESDRNRELLAANADRFDPMKITANQCAGEISEVRDGGCIILASEIAEACLRGVIYDIVREILKVDSGVLPTWLRVDITLNPDPPPTLHELCGKAFKCDGRFYRAHNKIDKKTHTLFYGPAWQDPPYEATGYVEQLAINPHTEAGKKALRRLEILP